MTAVCYRFDSLWVGERKLNWMEVSCKTTKKPIFPYNPGVGTRHFSRFRHIIIVSNILFTKNGSGNHKSSHILTSYSFPFLHCFMAIIKILDGPRDGGVRGAGGRKVFAHGWVLSVSDLTFLMWGGSCKKRMKIIPSRASPFIFSS